MKIYSTFKERNDMLIQFDRLPREIREKVLLQTLGAYSVTSNEPFFWQHLEKYMKDFTDKQPSIFQDVRGNKIDEFSKATLQKLDKPIGGHID